MNVKLLFFGELKTCTGHDHMTLSFTEDTSCEKLLCQALNNDETFKIWRARVMYAVNTDQVGPETIVKEGDEVAFLPPMSGG